MREVGIIGEGVNRTIFNNLICKSMPFGARFHSR